LVLDFVFQLLEVRLVCRRIHRDCATVGSPVFGPVFATLLWQFAGREMIALSSMTLTHRVEAFGLGRTRSYRASEIHELRASINGFGGYGRSGRTGMPFAVGGAGSLVFDYGARTIRMAAGLDEAEAKMLVKEFSTRLKG
jgi:hypothetical protein